MGRGKAFLEQQAYRVALVAKAGLQADKDVAEAAAQNMHAAPVGLVPAGGCAPDALDIL